MYALISTVTPGAIIRRAEVAGDPNPAKGLSWIPDNPPDYDPARQTRTQDSPVPVDAAEVPYSVVDIPLADIRAARKILLRNAFEARGLALVAGYAPTERETWPEQVRAAMAYQANSEGDHDYLEGLAKEGESLATVAATILAKHAAFLGASAPLVRNRRALEAAIDAAETIDAVLAVDIDAGWS